MTHILDGSLAAVAVWLIIAVFFYNVKITIDAAIEKYFQEKNKYPR